MPSYNEMVIASKSTKKSKFGESIALFGIVSAVFNASYAFGEGFGPILGGILIEEYGFEVTYSFKDFGLKKVIQWSLAGMAGISALVSIPMIIFYGINERKTEKKEEECDTRESMIQN